MEVKDIILIIKPETELECKILEDTEFIQGVQYGKPRPGHPEGEVIKHIKEVLANVDKYCNEVNRKDLRLIALLHDTFKYMVDDSKPKHGDNHHGHYAKIFASQYIKNNDLLSIIELHDEAYNAWASGDRRGDWNKAVKRANQLIQGLLIEGTIDLYVDFYRCDNETGDKTQECFKWFTNLIK